MRCIAIVPSLMLVASAAHAVEFHGVEVSGFASLGYVNSSHNEYLAEGSVDGSWQLNDVALNFGYQATDRLRFATQIYASNLGNAGEDARYEDEFLAPTYSWKNGGAALDLIFAQYTVADELGVRVGRVKQPFGLYNEVRDIDAVRGSATLPQAVYDNRSREYDFAVNGAAIYGSVGLGKGGAFDYHLFGGTLDVPLNGPVANQYTTPEFALTSVDVDLVYGGQIMWSPPVDGLRVGASVRVTQNRSAKLQWNDEYYVFGGPGFGYHLPDESMNVSTDSFACLLSAEYVVGELTLQAEYMRVSSEQSYSTAQLNLVPEGPLLPSFYALSADKSNSEGWYLMAGYRPVPNVELGGFGSFYTAEISHRSTKNWNNYQNDFAVFARLDSDVEGLLFKVEGHIVRGTGLLDVPDKQQGYFNTAPTTEENWHYVVFKTAYSF